MGLNKTRTIHMVGIGGSGMSGIAEVLLNLGHLVQGSDITRSDVIYRLEKLGARISIGHDGDNIGDAEVLVISSAVQPDNPEVVTAKSKKIPVIPRAEMLAELMRMKEGIAVAGAHGKTTTSTLVATILSEAGMDPTVIIGGRVKSFGTGGRLGEGEFIVAEADESDGSFLELDPTIAVVTNMDAEHLDHYGSMERLEEAFLQFCNKVPFFGATIACGDDPILKSFASKMNKKFITFGFSKDCDLTAKQYVQNGLECGFTVCEKGVELGKVELHLPGRHNVLNCLAAIQVALFLEIDFKTITEGLKHFSGIGRRVELKGENSKGITVIDDYGHHPTEIEATLKGLKEAFKGRRLVTLFQPHRYSRTRDCIKEFSTAFADTDVLAVAPIYPAGEKPIEGINAKLISDSVAKTGHENVFLIEKDNEIKEWIKANTEDGDILLTLGAGNIFLQGEKFLENGKG